jgi:hypothetical protein
MKKIVLFIVIAMVATSSAALIGHWPLDGNTNDISGSGNNGITVGSPQYVDGQVGKAMLFDGLVDGVTIPNESLFDLTGEMTLSCWVKIPAGARPTGVVVGKKDFLFYPNTGSAPRNKGEGWGFESAPVRYEGGVMWYVTCDDAITSLVSSTKTDQRYEAFGPYFNTHNDGDWHHYAAVTKLEPADSHYYTYLYIDGVYQGKAVCNRPPESTSGNWVVPGYYQNDASLSFGHTASFPGLKNWAGYLDDVRVYNNALSAAEVLSLFTTGNGCTSPKDGDINGDCEVTFDDFALLAQDWLQCGMYYSADCL